MTSGGEAVLFWVLAPISVIGALGLLFFRKAVHAALGTALVMINLGVFYIAQNADFLGIIQIFVYTGAVMMLFLFVLMLVGVDSSDSLVETIKGQKVAGFLLALGMGIVLIAAIGSVTFAAPVGLTSANAGGNISGMANLIFGRYVWVGTPALLPNGAPSELSVSRVLASRDQVSPPQRLVDIEAAIEREIEEGTNR